MSLTVLREKYKGNPNHVGVLNYLEDLANTVGHDISKWDIDKIFLDKTDPLSEKLILSPRTLNKLFFEQVKVSELVKEKTSKLSPEQLLEITKAIDSIMVAKKGLIDQEISSKRSALDEASRRVQTATVALSNAYQKKVSGIQNLMRDVNEIINMGYEWMGARPTPFGESKTLNFITQPLFMKWKRSDGVEMHVPFGKFKVELDVFNSFMRVKPYSDTICYDRYYHPFISHEGSICWGSANTTAGDLIAKNDFVPVFRILSALLLTYPGGTPYMHLDDFYFRATNEFGENTWCKTEDMENFKKDSRLARTIDDDAVYCEHCDENNVGHDSDGHIFECEDCGTDYEAGDGHTCSERDEDF